MHNETSLVLKHMLLIWYYSTKVWQFIRQFCDSGLVTYCQFRDCFTTLQFTTSTEDNEFVWFCLESAHLVSEWKELCVSF